MGRTRSGHTAPPLDGDALLGPRTTVELQLGCARLGLDVPAERDACVDAIKALGGGCRNLARMLGTNKFAEQLETWRGMVARGLEPTLERMRLLWLHDIEGDDPLRLLCVYAGVETTDGPRDALLARLEAAPGIKGCRQFMDTPLWDYHLANLPAYLASNPPRIKHEHAWLRLMDADGLRLMCKSLGMAIDGDHGALLARLVDVPDIHRYKGYVGCSWWDQLMGDREELAERFAKYQPSVQHVVQTTIAYGPSDVDVAAKRAQEAKPPAPARAPPVAPQPSETEPTKMEWLEGLSTKRLLQAAADVGLDTTLARTREDLRAGIRASPDRHRLLKRNLESDGYEELAKQRRRTHSSLANTTKDSALYDNYMSEITMHWMAGRPPPGVTGGSVSHSSCLRGKSILMLRANTAVRWLKEQLAKSVPGVDADAFVLWYLPEATTNDCLLAWRPGSAATKAQPIHDYAHVGDVLPHDSPAQHKEAILVAVPKALSEATMRA